jgi:predicted MPP superfamily phosphohydrolase
VFLIMFLWMMAWWAMLGLVIAPVVPGHWLTIALAALVGASPLLVFAQRLEGGYPSAALRLFVFRPFWYVQLALPLTALAGIAGALVGLPFGAGLRMGQGAAIAFAVAYALVALAGFVGSRLLRVRELDVFVPDLPAAFAGLRIAQVSDLHVGPHTSRRHLAKVTRAIRTARPDLIAITGDQVDDYGRDVETFARVFGELSAPLGVFAVAGNHDVYAGWPQVRAGLESMGATVLVNDALAIEREGERLWIAGTGDPAAGGRGFGATAGAAPDISRTLARVPADSFVIALAHNPALWPSLADRGVQLTLSGHTHHGQLSIPRINWSLASLFLEHAMGWHRRGRSLLYINPGTNYWGLPLRIGALPEVTVFTLNARLGEAMISPRP